MVIFEVPDTPTPKLRLVDVLRHGTVVTVMRGHLPTQHQQTKIFSVRSTQACLALDRPYSETRSTAATTKIFLVRLFYGSSVVLRLNDLLRDTVILILLSHRGVEMAGCLRNHHTFSPTKIISGLRRVAPPRLGSLNNRMLYSGGSRNPGPIRVPLAKM